MYNEFLTPIIKTISYPDADLYMATDELMSLCGENDDDVRGVLREFKAKIEVEDLEKLRENYTKTFDLKAMACLDIGYVLFGEDYKRGAFLVEIQRMQKENGIEAGSELPDHLPNFLKLLAALPEDGEKKELVEKIFLPALSKILDNFERERNTENYYRFPLLALKLLSEKEFKMNETVLKGAY